MTMTRTIPAGEFKARCLALLDEVSRTGEEIIVTKRGKPVARVVPPVAEKTARERLLNTIVWQADDIVAFDASGDWEALS